MKLAKVAVVLALAAVLAGGCARKPEDPYEAFELGPGREIVVEAVNAIGGLEAWKNVNTIEADAIVTIYDAEGVPFVTAQELTVSPHGGALKLTESWIAVDAPVGEGWWKVRVDADGDSRFRTSGVEPSAKQRRRITERLGVLLHRMRGPLNLLGRGEKVRTARKTTLAGVDVVRVGVSDGPEATAYYFAADSGLLQFVTTGADKPGQDGTITVYDWKVLANGMAVPDRLRVHDIGDHVLIGDRLLLEAKLDKTRIDQKGLLDWFERLFKGHWLL